MSVTTVRAAQNSYTNDQTGGTRDPQFVDTDLTAFMDAIERRDTPFLNTIKKGGAGKFTKHEWGIQSVTPRASTLGADALLAATSVTVPTGHSARFQQGHVLRALRKSDNATELMWVNDDPGNDTLSVTRGIGSTTALDLVSGDELAIVGIAMPELSDFPLAPVSRGHKFYNYYQEFSKYIVHSDYSDVMPSYDNPNGSLLAKDMLTIGKDIKLDLDRALFFGRRSVGDPNPAGPVPRMLGGLLQFAELSGNVFDVGGPTILLTKEAIEFVQHELHYAVGDNAGRKYLMSWRTKQIFNRLTNPQRYYDGGGMSSSAGRETGVNVDTRWNSLTTDIDTINFTYIEDMPDGLIVIYNDKDLSYNPFQGLDWKEKEFSTPRGNYREKGISGAFTFAAESIPGMAIIKGFDTDLSDYPNWSQPSSFLA